MRAEKKPWTYKELERAKRMREVERLGWKQIGKILGRSKIAVRVRVVRAGHTPVKKGLPRSVVESVLKDCRRGYSDPEVAERNGVGLRSVFKYRKLAGLPGNKRRPRSVSKARRSFRELCEAGNHAAQLRAMDERLEALGEGWSVPMTVLERKVCLTLLGGARTAGEVAYELGQVPKTRGDFSVRRVLRGLVVLGCIVWERRERGRKYYYLLPGVRVKDDEE